MLTTMGTWTCVIQTGLLEQLLRCWVTGMGTLHFHRQCPYFRRFHETSPIKSPMKPKAFLSIAFATVATAGVLTTSLWGEGQSSIKKTSENRFIPRGRAAPEGPAQFFSFAGDKTAVNGENPTRRPRDAEAG